MANMDFFNRIGNSITAAGKDGMAKARELKDTAKISVDIRERENAIQKMYRELGKAYYHAHKDDADSEYADRVAAIKAAFEEIGELKSSKDDIRGIRRCPECGEPIAANAKFCGNCGAKCEEEVVECEVVEDDDIAEETEEMEADASEECGGAEEAVEESEETEDTAEEGSAEETEAVEDAGTAEEQE